MINEVDVRDERKDEQREGGGGDSEGTDKKRWN
jgi:hypothetical protein